MQTFRDMNNLGLRVADHINAMLAYWDKDGICRFANNAYMEWFGKSQEEMINKIHIKELLGPLYESNSGYITGVLNGTPQLFESEIKVPSGDLRWMLVHYYPDITEEGIRGFYVHAVNITPMKIMEKKLASSEAKCRQILESIPDAVILTDDTGEIKMINHQAEKLFGYKRDELIGKTTELLFKKDHKNLINHSNYSFDVILEGLMLRKDENTINVEIHNKPVQLEDGVFSCISIRDISWRKKAEKDLEESNERNKIFVQQAPNALAMFDKQMRYLAASKKWITDYKLEGIDILNKSHYDIFPEIGDDWKAIHQNCLKGEINICPESKFVRADGTSQWIRWDVRPWYISEGNIGGLLMYTEDITTTKTAEFELHRINEELQSILNSGHVSIIGTDKNGIITHFNRGAEKLLQYSASEMIGLKTPECIHVKEEIIKRGEELSKLTGRTIAGFDAFVELANQGEYDSREWTYVRKDGTTFPVQLVVTAIYNKQKQIIGYLGVGTDISEVKKVELEMKSLLEISTDQNERLKNFAHIVSHNLRSLSGNISALLGLYIRTSPEVESNEFISQLLIGTKNLQDTINELTDIVTITTSITEKLVPVNLSKSIQSAISNVSQITHEVSITLENNVPANVEVLGLPAYVNSILLNFITNGIKYRAKNRPPFVKLSTTSNGDYWVLNIEDNGLGIDLTKFETKLFGLYKTFHGNKDSRGIGLYITKNQVEALGGKIEVESEPDKGTTFRVYFKKG